jgi:hypothetical protein
MKAEDELRSLYEQWRQLTHEEGHAIESSSWLQLGNFQAAKSRLQTRIVEVSQRLDSRVHEEQFKLIVDALINLERQNTSRLTERRRSAETEKQELEISSRNLRQIHRSYVPALRANWQSYS